jgi:hypothetical protein
MIPYLGEYDLKLFYNYLDNSTVYFEYGSGGSTYQSFLRNNLTKIYSVESDFEWHNKLKSIIVDDANKIDFFYNELYSISNTWGYPGPNCSQSQMINYSNQITLLETDKIQKIDFILIDGRFRVACCLKCFNVIKDECWIAFDDFLPREEYHIVLDYYDIIEKTVDNNMVILKKKTNITNVPNNIIEQYELIPH